MSRRHAEAVQVQMRALMAPAKALLLRLEKDPTLLSELEFSDLVQFVSKCARPLSQLLEAERKARGVESASDEACCEHEVARRRLASATNAELMAIMTGSPIVE